MKRTFIILAVLLIPALLRAQDAQPVRLTLLAGETISFESPGWNGGTEAFQTSMTALVHYGILFGGAGVSFPLDTRDRSFDASLSAGAQFDLALVRLSGYGLIQKGFDKPEGNVTLGGAGVTVELPVFIFVSIFADLKTMYPFFNRTLGYYSRPSASALTLGLSVKF